MANQHWRRRRQLKDKQTGIPYHQGVYLSPGANGFVPTLPYKHFAYNPFGGGKPNHMEIRVTQGPSYNATYGRPNYTLAGMPAGQTISQPLITEQQFDTSTGIG